MEMTLDQYFEETGTSNYKGVRKQMSLMEAALGISGEISEVADAIMKGDKNHVEEEIGDAMYYVCLLITSIGFNPSSLISTNYSSVDPDSFTTRNDEDVEIMAILLLSGRIADSIKKLCFKGGDTDYKLLGECSRAIVYTLASLAKAHDTTLSKCLQNNLDKIKNRHPNGIDR